MMRELFDENIHVAYYDNNIRESILKVNIAISVTKTTK